MQNNTKILIVILLIVAGIWYTMFASHFYPKSTNTPTTMPTTVQENIREAGRDPEDGTLCVRVITPAFNPKTNEIREFPTPCDVPKGWDVIQNDIPSMDLEVL